MKEQAGQPRLRPLLEHERTAAPASRSPSAARSGALDGHSSVPTGAWSHLAATYDGATLRLYVNGTQVAQLAVTGSIADVGLAAADRRQRHLGRVVQRPDRRGAGLQPRARAQPRSRATWSAASRRTSRAPTVTAHGRPLPGSAGINVGTSATATFNELDERRLDHDLDVPAAGRRPTRSCPRPSRTTPTTSTATLTPQAALAVRRDLHRDRRRAAPAASPTLAGNPLAADSTWSFTTEASPPPILVVGSTGEPVRLVPRRDPPQRGPERVHDDRRRLPLARAPRADSTSSCSARRRSRPAQVTTLTGWVNGGGNLIAMRPDKQLAGLLGLTDAGTTLANAYLQVATRLTAPGAGIVGSTMQFHGVADRYTLNGATSVATLYSTATTATTNPAVTLRIGRRERRPGGRVHLRPRALRRLHAPGKPRLGRPGARRRRRHPTGRPLLRRPRRRRAARLGRHEQDRDPAGGRAAAAAAQPDHADGARQDAAAAVLVPAARREGRGRDERRRPLPRDRLRAARPATSTATRRSALPAAASPTGSACARARTSIPNATLTNAQAATYIAEGFEVGVHPLVASCPTTAMTEARARRRSTTRSWRSSRRSTRACRLRCRAARTASTGPTGPRTRRSSSRAGSGWTPTTTTTPAPGSAPSRAS